jgi:large subunit ribosomal protein L21
MYAVVRVGGKQERVEPGDVIEVEFMKADPGDSVELDPIVVFDDDGKAHVGKALSKASVKAKLLGDKKGDKVRVFKYRSKTGYRRQAGHRQLFTLLEIEEVALSPQKKTTAAEAKAAEPASEKAAAPKKAAGPKKAAAKKTPTRKSPAKKAAAKKTTTRKAPSTRKTTSRKKPT